MKLKQVNIQDVYKRITCHHVLLF